MFDGGCLSELAQRESSVFDEEFDGRLLQT